MDVSDLFFYFVSLLDTWYCFFFFFQAEDGIRDLTVTGVQTCALPIFAMPADATHHGYISEHHSYGQNEMAAGEYAEDLAASMLATVLGVPFDPEKAWDERREQWLLSGEIVRTMNVTSAAECGDDGRWTTVVSAVCFCG